MKITPNQKMHENKLALVCISCHPFLTGSNQKIQGSNFYNISLVSHVGAYSHPQPSLFYDSWFWVKFFLQMWCPVLDWKGQPIHTDHTCLYEGNVAMPLFIKHKSGSMSNKPKTP